MRVARYTPNSAPGVPPATLEVIIACVWLKLSLDFKFAGKLMIGAHCSKETIGVPFESV